MRLILIIVGHGHLKPVSKTIYSLCRIFKKLLIGNIISILGHSLGNPIELKVLFVFNYQIDRWGYFNFFSGPAHFQEFVVIDLLNRRSLL